MRLLRVIGRRFSRNKLSVLSAITILLLITASILAPFIAPYDPTSIDVHNVLSPPNQKHLLGTDELGRDLLSRIIWGSRVSLKVGFVVIGLTSWMDVARLVRAEFLSLKEKDFVGAARAVGASDKRLIFTHILPNALSPVFVAATFGVAGAILIESGLSFLGLGVQPPDPSWGNILTAGKDNIEIALWLSLYSGLAILITVLSYNLVGEGLRDALDPRLWDTERR